MTLEFRGPSSSLIYDFLAIVIAAHPPFILIRSINSWFIVNDINYTSTLSKNSLRQKDPGTLILQMFKPFPESRLNRDLGNRGIVHYGTYCDLGTRCSAPRHLPDITLMTESLALIWSVRYFISVWKVKFLSTHTPTGRHKPIVAPGLEALHYGQ